ncbi:max-binding protein MNT-like isoform X2 [Anthonomus grandis grandis]|uniref:max-binding protein MNT-like isoform X2 n=1 Tax=Anthonomus grandis grandis TaxID=2921223 RepID=UPI0021666FF7|nr:max-binding protein MNT-like isoform X2 [Anthonomus grandis grandis]
MGSKKMELLPKNTRSLSNVKIILFQPLSSGPAGVEQTKMSLSTLLEAAKFLEMQEEEQRQQHMASTMEVESPPSGLVTIRPVNGAGGAQPVQNGTSGNLTQTFTLQPVKILNATSNNVTATTIGNVQGQQPQTTQAVPVVISSNNISSTFLQGPVSFATASPTINSPQNGTSINNNASPPHSKKEQDGHISSTTVTQGGQRYRIMQNSFDIMNPLIIDESGTTDKKIKQPPMVFRSGTREVHNKLEKHRRAHLKECFDILKKQLPSNGEEKKTSNLSILHSALKYIQSLKKREREYEHEMERLAREKIHFQQRLASLRKDSHFDNDFSRLIPEIPSSTTSITQNGKNEISPSHPSQSPNTRIVSPTYTVEQIKGTSKSVKVEDCYSDYVEDRGVVATPLNNVVSVGSIVTVASSHSAAATVSSSGLKTEASSSPVINQTNSVITTTNGESKISAIPILSKTHLPIVTTAAQVPVTNGKEVAQSVQTTGISVLPMPYPVNPGLVLQKVAIVPHKGLTTDLAPLMPTHFITTPQQLRINGQINGKVVPLTQYIVKPMVVVSTASPRPGS